MARRLPKRSHIVSLNVQEILHLVKQPVPVMQNDYSFSASMSLLNQGSGGIGIQTHSKKRKWTSRFSRRACSNRFRFPVLSRNCKRGRALCSSARTIVDVPQARLSPSREVEEHRPMPRPNQHLPSSLPWTSITNLNRHVGTITYPASLRLQA